MREMVLGGECFGGCGWGSAKRLAGKWCLGAKRLRVKIEVKQQGVSWDGWGGRVGD